MPVWAQLVSMLGGSTLIALIITFVFNKFTNSIEKKRKDAQLIAEEVDKKNEANNRGVQALLRHELYDMYNEHYPKGYAPADVKNDFENIYVSYHNLGKNGVMDGMHQRFMELPEFPESNRQRLVE